MLIARWMEWIEQTYVCSILGLGSVWWVLVSNPRCLAWPERAGLTIVGDKTDAIFYRLIRPSLTPRTPTQHN
jgi:hypothetical protein